ncbi:glycosyltransferase family 2 protein [Rubrolithibacter danxiaensis]|uniref:glycosyltransferase family 2 protein n=1 Tax=Rubrolithibacter danxiaensis TaxID=3390805 RepID=UPI003BF8EB81
MGVKISVVIPTYRRPDLLVRCLNALFEQNFNDSYCEIVVISDGPDDTTEKALKKLKKPANLSFKYLSTPKKKGPAAARNLGWLEAKGSLIAFTDDDCIPDKNWLYNICNSYLGEEEIVYTGYVKVPLPDKPTDYELNIYNLETAEFVTANCVCTKKALLKVGGFDERFQIAWREDSDLHFKFLKQGISIKKIDATVVHPVRKAHWGISIKEQKKGIFNALLYKKYPDLYRKRIKPYPSWNYYCIIICTFAIAIGILNNILWLFFWGLCIWLLLITKFINKRLSATTHSFTHVLEIIVTSVFIPFFSVYWQLYGAVKYRVLFI